MSQDYQTPSNFTHSTTNESVSPNTIASGHGSILILKSGPNNNSITDSKLDCENFHIIEYEEFQPDWKFRKLSFSEASSQQLNIQKNNNMSEQKQQEQNSCNNMQESPLYQQQQQQKQLFVNTELMHVKTQQFSHPALQVDTNQIMQSGEDNKLTMASNQSKTIQQQTIQTQTEMQLDSENKKQKMFANLGEKHIESDQQQDTTFLIKKDQLENQQQQQQLEIIKSLDKNQKQYQFLNDLLLPPQQLVTYSSVPQELTQKSITRGISNINQNLNIFIEEGSQNHNNPQIYNVNGENLFEQTLDLNAEKDVQLISFQDAQRQQIHGQIHNIIVKNVPQKVNYNGNLQQSRQSSTTVRDRTSYFQDESIVNRRDQGQKDFFLSTGSISSLRILNSSQKLNSSMKLNTQSIKFNNTNKFNNTDELDRNVLQQVKREETQLREIQFLKREVVKLNQCLKEKDLDNMKFRDKMDSQTDLIMRLEEKLYRVEEDSKCQQEMTDSKLEKILFENEKLFKKKENLKAILKERDKEIQLLKSSLKDNYIEEENNLLKQRVQYFATLLESHDETLREKELQHKNQINQLKEQTYLELKNKCTENELLMLENRKLQDRLEEMKNQVILLQNERQSWLTKEDNNGLTNYQQHVAGASTFSSSSHKKSTATYYESYSGLVAKKPSPPSKQSSLIRSCEFASTNASSTQKSSANSTSLLSYNNSKNINYMKSLFDSDLRQISVQSDQVLEKENCMQGQQKHTLKIGSSSLGKSGKIDQQQCIISKFLDESNQYIKFMDSPTNNKSSDNNKHTSFHHPLEQAQAQQQYNQSFDLSREYLSVPSNSNNNNNPGTCSYEMSCKFKRRGGISENSFQNEANNTSVNENQAYSSSQKIFKKPPRVDSIPRNIGKERPPLTTINFNKKCNQFILQSETQIQYQQCECNQFINNNNFSFFELSCLKALQKTKQNESYQLIQATIYIKEKEVTFSQTDYINYKYY